MVLIVVAVPVLLAVDVWAGATMVGFRFMSVLRNYSARERRSWHALHGGTDQRRSRPLPQTPTWCVWFFLWLCRVLEIPTAGSGSVAVQTLSGVGVCEPQHRPMC
jgi:hypothetical protein